MGSCVWIGVVSRKGSPSWYANFDSSSSPTDSVQFEVAPNELRVS